jgi:CheY-like chemotaxis protein
MSTLLHAFTAVFLNPPAPCEVPAGADNPTEDAPAPHGTVLLIDDDPGLLEALKPAFTDAGYQVLATTSPTKGLDLARYAAKNIRLVLLDFNMPRLDGAVTLAHLRHLLPQAQVVGLTGMSLESIPAEFRDGVNLFLTKPFRTVELIHTVSQLTGPPGALLPAANQ